MEVKGENYQVKYDPSTTTVTFAGTLRLRGITEYNPIVALLTEAAGQEGEMVTLDLRELQFLNSSGINILFRFVIEIREQGNNRLSVRGSSEIPWQQKSLKNLQRLMAEVNLELV